MLMKKCTLAVALVATVTMVGAAKAATVNWVGGTGTWYIGTSSWESGGATMSADDAFGSTNGWEYDGTFAPADVDIVIGAGGIVDYDALTADDFRLKGGPADAGSLTIKDGGSLTLGLYGFYTEIDCGELTITGAGSQLIRFNTDIPQSPDGGIFTIGSWRSTTGQTINMNIMDGGLFDNEGQVAFGSYQDSDPDLTINMTVGNHATVLNNSDIGDALEQGGELPQEGFLNFQYNWDVATSAQDDPSYSVNFTGNRGSYTVGAEGIQIQNQQSAVSADWTSTAATYEDLWDGVATGKSADDEILSYEGVHSSDTSGLFQFADFFQVTGSFGDASYTVESVGGALDGGSRPGDLNGDDLTDAGDFGILAGNFGTAVTPTTTDGDINWTAAAANGGDDFVDAADIGVMFGAWTGDHPPATPGSATAHYDPATGEIDVDVNGVVNWYVENVGSASMTGDAPAGLPQAPGLVTDNDTRIGESAFAPFSYSQNLGNVAAAGLTNEGTLQIFWNASLGGQLQSAEVQFVPEPTTLALASLALCGVMASRRRRVA